MIVRLLFFITLVLGFSISGCKNISEYPIDSHPLAANLDTNLYGIWKAKEDTSSRDYFIVQSNQQVFNEYLDIYKNANKEWTSEEGHRSVLKRYEQNKYGYLITYMNHAGTNPICLHWPVFLSKIRTTTFFNIGGKEGNLEGYMFARIVQIDLKQNNFTVAMVADTTLRALKNSMEVRDRLEKNLNNPAFYKDTFHFFKVSGYHASIEQSGSKANP